MRVLYCLLICVLQNKLVSAGICSDSCNCSSGIIPFLDPKEYFILHCSDDNIGSVSNASEADAFYYRASDLSIVMDSNILYKFSNLKYLEIDGGVNSLTFIPPITSLRILQIMYTSISYLPDDVLAAVSKIFISLSLTFSEIDVISEDAFAGLDSLRVLNLSHNRLEKVYSGLQLSNLKTLDLSFNYIRSVSSSDFTGLDSLLWLSLDGNNIYSLSYVEFPSSGVSLFVRNNPLNVLSWRASSVRKLSLLEINGNLLSALAENTITNSHIDTIKISECSQLRLVDARAFVNVTVTNISITNNPKLEFIDPNALKFVRSLRNLNISYNNLHVIPEELSQLADIEYISVMGNSLLCDCNMKWIETSDVEIDIEPSTSPSACSGGGDVSQRLRVRCEPRIAYRSRNATVTDEGSSVTLRCKFSGIPTPTVIWLYGDRPMPSGTSIETVNGDLQISQSRSSYAGVYKCVGSNSEGVTSVSFHLAVTKDNAKIIILKTGKDYVEFSWRTTNQLRRYKAILVDVQSNNQTSYDIKQFSRSRHSQSGYVISGLQTETTYRVCLAYEGQMWADNDKCETITTLAESAVTPRGITDYTLYGFIVSGVVCAIFIFIIVCVCVTSRNYASRKRRQMREGMVSESSYGLMTTSFSQRSGMSNLYDNPASSLSRNGSYYKQIRGGSSTAHTPTSPTSPTVRFSPDLYVDDASGLVRILKRTVSDPLISSSSNRY